VVFLIERLWNRPMVVVDNVLPRKWVGLEDLV
jgi:hypothetical protein